MSAHETDPEKETVFIHEISPELERELMRRAREKDHSPAEEASEIIEKHIGEDGEGTL